MPFSARAPSSARWVSMPASLGSWPQTKAMGRARSAVAAAERGLIAPAMSTGETSFHASSRSQSVKRRAS